MCRLELLTPALIEAAGQGLQSIRWPARSCLSPLPPRQDRAPSNLEQAMAGPTEGFLLGSTR